MSNSQDAGVPDDLVELGWIVSAYGIKGWVKIQPHSAQSEALLGAGTWWLRASATPLGKAGALLRPMPAKVIAARHHGANVVAQLDVAADRDAAEKLKGHSVWVPRASFPAAGEDEYYWVDLIGCRLYGEQDGQPTLIGQVVEVIDNGAHAVLRVARGQPGPTGDLDLLRDAKGRTVDVLVPFVSAHVHTVDIAGKRLDSNWPAEF